MNVRNILIEARAKIAKPENWTQKAAARDKDGFSISVFHEHATRWCAAGAVRAVVPMGESNYVAALHRLEAHLPSPSVIAMYNDSHTHAEVLAKFDEAITSLERSE